MNLETPGIAERHQIPILSLGQSNQVGVKLSVVMTVAPDRIKFFKWSLPFYICQGPREDLELVIVEEIGKEEARVPSIRDELLEAFGSVKYIAVDSTPYIGKVRFHTGPLCLNIAVKAASHEAILGTHPEVLQLGTIHVAKEIFRPYEVVNFESYMSRPGIYHEINTLLSKGFPILELPSVEHPPIVSLANNNCWYWISMLLPKSEFIRVGGYDEKMMENWGCDDCMLGWSFINNGVPIYLEGRGKVLHLYHPAKLPQDYPVEYGINYDRCESLRRGELQKCNEGVEWGKRDIVVNEEVWE